MKASAKKNENKMNKATDLAKRESSAGAVEFPAIGTGKMVKIDPKNIRTFDDVGLGTGLWPDDMQVPMSALVGKEVVVVDAKIGLKGIIADKETEYGVVRLWADKKFSFLPDDAPEYEEGTKEYDEVAVTVEQGQFYTTATGGIVAYRQVSAAVTPDPKTGTNLLPLRATVLQSAPKSKGMNGYYYFGKALEAAK